MSNTTIESPVAASQLFFAWSEQAEVEMAPPVASKKAPPQRAKEPSQRSPTPATAPFAPQAPRSSECQQSGNQQQAAADQARSAVAQPQLAATVPTGHLTFTSDGRIARPVRIGSVMIKLLKRYGITDAEIAEGVASYARKHQQAWAS